MTTAKEDQIRAEFTYWTTGMYDDYSAIDVWKACAESYEKKLEEKDAELDKQIGLKNDWKQELATLAAQWNATIKQLSEANERNARLVEAVVAMADDGWLYHGPEGMSEAQKKCYEAYQAISANSEAVAAWEAEKLEPLRREVAMLAALVSHVKAKATCGLIATQTEKHWYLQEIEGMVKTPAINNTQATAEAYEREIAERAENQLIMKLATVMDNESDEGTWRVSVDYDNYQDGARILDGDGRCISECYDVEATPNQQVLEAIRRIGSV